MNQNQVQTGLTDYDEVLKDLEKNKVRIENGLSNSLLFPIDDVNQHIPGITPRRYDIITAGTKVGKSKFFYYFYIIHHILKEMKGQVDMPYHGIIFSLEISKKEFIIQLQCAALYHIYGIEVDDKLLKSYNKENPLPNLVLEKLKELKESFFTFFYKRFKIIDSVKNPTGIYKETRRWLAKFGKFINNAGQEVNPEKGEAYKYFKPDEEGIYMCCVDHLSLIGSESGLDLRQSILKMSKYFVLMRNNWGMNIAAIQQQANDGQKQSFDYSGDLIMAKLFPSGNNLADCKDTQKDCDLMLGLFSPATYRIETFNVDGREFDITALKNNYRCLFVLLDRNFGSAPAVIHLGFKGNISYFKSI